MCEENLTLDRFETWTVAALKEYVKKRGLPYVCMWLIMVALCNRADHYIFMLWFVFLLLLLFSPRLISAAADSMSAILPHMVWP